MATTAPTSLTSPGALTAARARLEDALAPGFDRAVAGFLADMRRLTLADPLARPTPAYALTAAAADEGEPRDPLTAAQAEAAWVIAVDALIVAVLASMPFLPTPVRQDYEARLRRRLLHDKTPDEAMAAATAALSAAAAGGWAREQTSQVVTLALTMDLPEGKWPTGLPLADTIPAYDWLADRDRLTRTEATAAHNVAVDAALAEQGFTRKRWLARKDKRTRDSHAAADGQTVPLGQPFLVGGTPIAYPGDPSGPPEETYNCRCVEVGVGLRPGTPDMEPQTPLLDPPTPPALPPSRLLGIEA